MNIYINIYLFIYKLSQQCVPGEIHLNINKIGSPFLGNVPETHFRSIAQGNCISFLSLIFIYFFPQSRKLYFFPQSRNCISFLSFIFIYFFPSVFLSFSSVKKLYFLTLSYFYSFLSSVLYRKNNFNPTKFYFPDVALFHRYVYEFNSKIQVFEKKMHLFLTSNRQFFRQKNQILHSK